LLVLLLKTNLKYLLGN